MQIKLTFIVATVAVMAATAFGKPVETQHICGNNGAVDPALEQHIADRVAASRKAGDNQRAAVVVPVYWHVITDGTSGKATSTQIQNTISLMNAEYAGTGFSFQLAGTDTTVNSNWYNNVNQGTSAEAAMKNALRKGGPESLNIYTVSFGNSGLLGYATFPWSYSSAPKNDGLVITANTWVGGSYPNYGTGKVFVHEAGHWFGLYHVFQGGCSGSGDGVDDTAPQSAVTRGCPTGQDSCPGGGLDNVHNHMDYSSDACRTDFTPGQISRMQSISGTYRF
ncbi:uncharacterized protein PFL1_05678 [Pseudozyma flocculosa PF-1]|uniref:Related to metalloprotease MEP1 n=2 Tax=Pseudozyma flocculosa TaxID=84751 RepID=A0A5C3FBV6_9BASI|nr:uncharacterized protein PFL1_05678 [Pseudozyma flocculosa PF-1]EPQ26699.1 hypothetical protein PFL1_05678 [Pseudozyma flocculosa PF-1]SPO40981.1 related to metalloprotease MEP1 [Pseudozyma flocculosa]